MQLSTSSENFSSIWSAMVEVRYDSDIGHDRVFLDFENTSWTSWPPTNTSQSCRSVQRKRSTQKSTAKGNSWAAPDFILALEWPYRDHVKHHAIDPTAEVPKACNSVQARKVECQISMHNDLHSSTRNAWHLPHSEIDKLVHFSEQLDLDDEQLTPVMAYSAIKRELPSDEFLEPILEALKMPLASVVQCSGFGVGVLIMLLPDVRKTLADRSLGVDAGY
ncbi:hypothetical protein LTR17_024965 [Elasticomyces elasticus]|nr:hypothetical protein LTR17_024965 [Elasticomyces elasticus]